MNKDLKKFPKKTNFNKISRGSFKIIKYNKSVLYKDMVVIKGISVGLLSWKVLNESTKIIKKLLKKKKNKIKIFINVNLNWPISRKPKGTRMGKGKGKVNFDDWFARVKANTIIFKIMGIDKLALAKKKKTILNLFPIPCIIQ